MVRGTVLTFRVSWRVRSHIFLHRPTAASKSRSTTLHFFLQLEMSLQGMSKFFFFLDGHSWFSQCILRLTSQQTRKTVCPLPAITRNSPRSGLQLISTAHLSYNGRSSLPTSTVDQWKGEPLKIKIRTKKTYITVLRFSPLSGGQDTHQELFHQSSLPSHIHLRLFFLSHTELVSTKSR